MSAPSPREKPRVATGPILIIEDEKDLVRLLKKRFELDGFTVVTASSAESGMKVAREEVPALILLDIALPAMDGLTFLRLLRRESRVPVILLSGRGSDVDRILGLKAGADDYVAKPFSVAELIARVECVLRRRGRDAAPKSRPSAS